jgi:hypothetical protein
MSQLDILPLLQKTWVFLKPCSEQVPKN